MVRVTRLELVRSKLHRILSPRCLPIPPHPQRDWSQLREVGSWLPHFQKTITKGVMLVREVGLEPTRLRHQFLRLTCLPFHHFRIRGPKSAKLKGTLEVYFAFYLFRQVINHKPHIGTSSWLCLTHFRQW